MRVIYFFTLIFNVIILDSNQSAFADVKNNFGEIELATEKGIFKLSISENKFDNLEAVNQHPFYKPQGTSNYNGISTSRIINFLKEKGITNLTEETPIILIDKSRSYSVELKLKEFAFNNLIAFKKNAGFIKEEDSGVQIIYSKEALNKFPNLKTRYYWCWWVKSIIIKSYQPEIQKNIINLNKSQIYKSTLPFPQSYGVSSISTRNTKNHMELYILKMEPNKIYKMHQLGSDNVAEIKSSQNGFFLFSSQRTTRGNLENSEYAIFDVELNSNHEIVNFNNYYPYIRKISRN